MTDLLLYSGIRDYIYARISFFTEQVLSQNLTLALSIIGGLLTLWVMIHGYLIATGRSQEGLKGFVFSLGKTYFIVAIALGVAAGGSFGVRTLTDTLSDGISQIMTGDSDVGSKCLTQDSQAIVGCKIDQNLTATQAMMSLLNEIDTADDDYLEEKLTEARWFAGVGTAGPAIVAGTLLIMFRIAMALFVGFAPIFILCLLFKKTAPLFQKWLYYGLSTIFSGVMLGVMADISMDLVSNITVPTASVDFISTVFTGEGTKGIMQMVTQQLGLGLMLSTLLITVPPMAGMWFNGVMASYSGYNAMQGWGAGQPATPPGMNSQQQQTNYNVQNRAGDSNNTYSNGHNSNLVRTDNSLTSSNQPTDTTKTVGQSDIGLAINQPKPYSPQPVSEGGKSSDKEKGK